LENPYYAAGQVYASSCLDTMLVQSFFNPNVVTLIEQLLSGCVYSMAARDIFSEFEGITCAHLLRALLEVDLVLLGLYRKSANRLRYVISNPQPGNAVQADDMIIVLESPRKYGTVPTGKPIPRTANTYESVYPADSVGAQSVPVEGGKKDEDDDANLKASGAAKEPDSVPVEAKTKEKKDKKKKKTSTASSGGTEKLISSAPSTADGTEAVEMKAL